MDKFVREVENADVEDFCKVLPDWEDDSSEKGGAVDVACDVHEYLPGNVIQHRMSCVEEVLGDIVSEISENQAYVKECFSEVHSAI